MFPANNTPISRLSYILTQSLLCFPLAISGSGGIFGEVQSVGLNQKVLLHWEFLLLSIANSSRQPRETRRFAQSPKSMFVLVQQWLKDWS
jgi:hypothetical protein